MSAETTAPPVTGQRWYGLDALRVALVLMVVLLHTGLSYTPVADWSVDDRDSQVVSLYAFGGNLCFMITFFLISGFAGRGLVESRGTLGFVQDRGVRMGLPLVIFGPIFYGVMYYLCTWGAAQSLLHGGGTVSSADQVLARYPLAHLWFLYIICLFYLAALPIRVIAAPIVPAVDRLVAQAVRWRLMPLLFGAPVAIIMTLRGDWEPWLAIPIPTLLPNPFAIVGYGAAFACGWLLHRQPHLLYGIARSWWTMLIAAVILFVGYLALLILYPQVMATAGMRGRLPFAVSFALLSWSLAMTLLAMFLRFVTRTGPVMGYLSETSYWTYLAHLPLTVLVPVLLLPYHWYPPIKFAIASAITLAILALSYEILVRRTFMARWLNGPVRKKTAEPLAPTPVAEPG